MLGTGHEGDVHRVGGSIDPDDIDTSSSFGVVLGKLARTHAMKSASPVSSTTIASSAGVSRTGAVGWPRGISSSLLTRLAVAPRRGRPPMAGDEGVRRLGLLMVLDGAVLLFGVPCGASLLLSSAGGALALED